MNILITGTSSGVGYGLAKFYLEKGHTVYGISRKPSAALDANDKFHYLSLDLSHFEKIEQKIPSFLKGLEKLDLTILNAGVLNGIKDLKDSPLSEIKHVMDVNVWSNKVLIETLFQHIQHIDSVVAISSGAAVSGSRGWNAYSLSKATLNMLIDLYAKEYTQTHFTALAPGLIDSNMQDYIYSLDEEEKFPVLKKLKAAKGTDKMPKPEKAAEIIASAIAKLKKYESGSFQDVRKM